MKKTVKGLIIAASVAAVVGVGAVSFAKWEAGTENAKTVENNTLGAVSVLKFDNTETAAVTGLLPIDQNTDAYNKETNPLYGVMEFNIEKSAGYAYTDFKLTVTLEKGTGIVDGTKFYVSTTAPTATSKGTEIVVPAAGDTETAAGAVLTYTIQTTGNYSLYVCHDSADMADMNKSFKLNLTLSDGTTTA